MTSYFIPYMGERPASIVINGHRVIILACEREVLAEGLSRIGADDIREICIGSTPEEQEELLGNLAQSVNGGVIVAPVATRVNEVIDELEAELPWLH